MRKKSRRVTCVHTDGTLRTRSGDFEMGHGSPHHVDAIRIKVKNFII